MITVKDILDQKGSQVYGVAPENTVYDALKLMSDKGIGALVVLQNERVIGIFSERDYARKIALQGKVSKDTQVKDVMSTEVYGVHLNTTAEECMSIMTAKRFRHLPVCGDNKVGGIVSIGDIVKAIIEQQKVRISHLEDFIMGKYPA